MGLKAFAMGTVKDSSSSPIQGAIVSWSPGSASDDTDGNGTYAAMFDTGTYNVTASKTGYTPQTKNNISYPPGRVTVVDFTLQAS